MPDLTPVEAAVLELLDPDEPARACDVKDFLTGWASHVPWALNRLVGLGRATRVACFYFKVGEASPCSLASRRRAFLVECRRSTIRAV